ncbi:MULTISPECIES: winged helix-turn-helix domain-containing protein [unclassified Streptomyces]|uniref:winged helix-turn-helix domain-containing protein n=1 Tax=unclassified Streptomyces TaxID=2593676 RepID=UPI00381BFEA3
MQAAELFAQQVKPSEVARRLRVSVKSVYQWQELWRQGGSAALVSRGLVPVVRALLAGCLAQGPGAHAWVEDQVWTVARVATLIGRKFHVPYSVSVATRLMRWLGFKPQMPARRVAERDGQAVAVRKGATWAEAKEPGRPAGDGSASRTRQASPAGRPKDAPEAGVVSLRS